MVHIQWKDRYNIGYKEIDAQHKGLLAVLNELIDMVGERRDPQLVTSIFQRLCQYVHTHFSTEERYMRACGYPRLEEHEALHRWFVEKLLELNHTYDPADPQLLDEALEFVKNWYLDHIIKIDTDYAPFLKRFQMNAPVKAILFDFGNVVCSFDNDRFLEGLSSLCGKPADVLKTRIYLQSTLPKDYEAGKIDSRAFLAGLSDLCEQELLEADFIRVYTEIFTPIDTTFDLIRKLKPGYRIGLISNTSPWHFEHAIRTVEIFPLFDSVTLSFEVGASKPDPRLFEDALSKLGLMAEECVYIDDQRPYASAATEQLMRGITYTTPVALMSQLRQLKVAF
jgi:HAD superfamily hydrolase (TIGR01549 family)